MSRKKEEKITAETPEQETVLPETDAVESQKVKADKSQNGKAETEKAENAENAEPADNTEDDEFAGSTIFAKNEHLAQTEKDRPKSGKSLRRKNLIALLILLVVMGGAFFGIIKFLPNLNNKNDDPSATAITVKSVEGTLLRKIKITSANGVLNLSGAPITVENTATDGTTNSETSMKWQLEGFDPTLIADSSINGIADNCATVTALRKMEKEDLDYGFNQPSLVAEVTLQDPAQNYTITMGSKSPDNSGYYTKVSGVDGIYLVSAGVYTSLSSTPEKLANTTIVSVPTAEDADAADKGYFSSEDGTLTKFDSITLSGGFYGKTLTLQKTNNDMANYSFTADGKTRYADADNTKAVLGILTNGIVAIDTYKLNPTAADYEKYGLKNPDAVITLKYGTQTLTLTAKKYDNENNYYAVTVSGKNGIYAVTADALNMLNLREKDFYNSFVFLEYLHDFSNFTVTANGKTYGYNISYDQKEEKMTVTTTAGAAVDDAALSDYYEYLLMMSPTAQESYKSGKADYTAEGTFRDSDKGRVKIELIKQSERRYLLQINGQKMGVVSSTVYDALTKYIDYVQSGQAIPEAGN